MKTSLFVAIVATLAATPVWGQLDVVATQPDLADVAREIGGDLVRVRSLTGGSEDLHMVRIRPSLLVAARRADAFIQLGLDAEHAWVPALLRTAKNRKIAPGADGFINASKGIRALRVPTQHHRGIGADVHPRGNPHFNLDPEGMRLGARNVRDGLARLLPDHREAIVKREVAWEKRLDERLVKWRKRLEPAAGRSFVEDHDAWIYFARRFGLRIAARLEPKPGLAPTPRHLAAVAKTVESDGCRLIVTQSRNQGYAKKVAGQTGATVVVLALSSASEGPRKGYLAFMDHVVDTFAGALVDRR